MSSSIEPGWADWHTCEVNETRCWPGSSTTLPTRSWRRHVARPKGFAGQLNATAPEELEERGRIAVELFAGGGQTVRIEPPFYCDYGFNIRLGESVYFNYNCVVLDVCEVRIGSFTMFGPAVQIYTALHPMNAELRRSVEFGKPVLIGSDVWVGGGAFAECISARVRSSVPAQHRHRRATLARYRDNSPPPRVSSPPATPACHAGDRRIPRPGWPAHAASLSVRPTRLGPNEVALKKP